VTNWSGFFLKQKHLFLLPFNNTIRDHSGHESSSLKNILIAEWQTLGGKISKVKYSQGRKASKTPTAGF
jgi:hypothetical protein